MIEVWQRPAYDMIMFVYNVKVTSRTHTHTYTHTSTTPSSSSSFCTSVPRVVACHPPRLVSRLVPRLVPVLRAMSPETME